MTPSIEAHLLYASIVWIAAWLLTSMPRGTATTKYWIWVATSINFILPLSALPVHLWPTRVAWFTPNIEWKTVALGTTAILVWAIGAVIMLVRLSFRIHADRRATHGTPAVIGFLRSQIFLPDGIERLLTTQELDAVLIHERTHARRRDNLIRLIYETSLCALWFHPLVWMTGSRLALYRELSCDESVTQRADGSHLVSALAKLASPDDALLLQATASSFISDRLARLTATQRTNRTANAMLAAVFAAVLLAAVIGPIARAAAIDACARTHAIPASRH